MHARTYARTLLGVCVGGIYWCFAGWT
jgi:hypothetical protein